jgi:hypothetical protein
MIKNTTPTWLHEDKAKGIKSKPWLLLLVTLFVGSMISAQSVHFNYTDGTKRAYNLEDVRKITFEADVMKLHLLDGSLYTWNVSTIGYYQYDEKSLNIKEWLNNANAWAVMVYPNPTNSNLNILFNLPMADDVSIRMYDLQGKLISYKDLGKKTAGEHQEVIDLTGIPQGTYVCRISGQNNTIAKQVIKQ